MNEPDKFIDLPPSEYHSERRKPREPFFGPGLPAALAYAFGMACTMTAIYFLKH